MAETDFVRYIPACKVSVGGAALDAAAGARLTRVAVRLDSDLFGLCSLTFHDPDLSIMNADTFQSGTPIEVKIGFASKLTKVFEGEVTALEPCFLRDVPPSLKVVCHESLHRLALSQATRALNDVDDKEIVTRIARDHGLTAEAPSGSRRHSLQSNVSDAVLLRMLAQQSGNVLRMEGKKLILGPPKKGEEIRIEPGSMLRKFKVRISAQQQVNEVTVHGWDPKAKREIVGKATPPPGETGAGAREHGKGDSLAVASHGVAPIDTASAEAMAKGRLQKLSERFVVAQGEMTGDPRVVPGALLALEKIDGAVDGSYRVDHAEHSFSKHGYLVAFRAVWVGKRQPPKPAKAPAAQPEREPPPPDLHLVVVEVKAIGGTPLATHPVRLVDPKTGEPASGILTTDAQGILRAQAPGPGKYRVEILDRSLDAETGPAQAGNDPPMALVCRFVGTDGAAIANESIEIKCGDDTFQLTTDSEGRIDAPATPAAYVLEICGESFTAHAVPAHQREAGLHLFVVGEEKHDQHVLAVRVMGIGDTPLVRHRVRVLDPDNGEPIGDWLETGDDGLLQTEVPDDRTYRIEIEDRDAHGGEGPELDPGRSGGLLVCVFTDASGAPIANEMVDANELKLETDAAGRLEAAAGLGAYELKLRGKTFYAHGLPAADAEKEENVYRFVVEDE